MSPRYVTSAEGAFTNGTQQRCNGAGANFPTLSNSPLHPSGALGKRVARRVEGRVDHDLRRSCARSRCVTSVHWEAHVPS